MEACNRLMLGKKREVASSGFEVEHMITKLALYQLS